MDVAFFFNSSPDFNNHYFILFFFLPFSANGIATIATNFFFPYFGNGITTIDFRSAGFGSRNFGNAITEIQNFLSHTFSLFLSYFCWISVTPLPKFTFFPQFPKKLGIIPRTQINSKFSNSRSKDSIERESEYFFFVWTKYKLNGRKNK